MIATIFFLIAIPAALQSFNVTSFDSSNLEISYKGDATDPNDSVIQQTETDTSRSGHAPYVEPMNPWDKSPLSLADFTTHFSFSINAQSNITHADGLAFFIASLLNPIPDEPDGSGLGLATGNIEFEPINGAKQKRLAELIQATNNFAEGRKLGEGGFGAVYRGFLKDLNSEVAVKRISNTSHQGIEEYASEVMVASHLRHRNLVQLIDWCHHKKELLLVYEYISNGSLDSHLFKGERLLTWNERYKIARGLASALHYLHFECEPCVLHRDIKPSNVLLDSSFNAKLGDFGLAQTVSHGKALQSTKFGGSFGYMAPEYVSTGRASKETDVNSFGIVVLEIACGRRPILRKANENQINIVEWLWELYARGKLMEAADPRLQGNFDERQMERLMILGLFCAHPDPNSRPSMKEVLNMLNFDVAPPLLPLEMPVLDDFSASFKVPIVSSMSSHTTTTFRRIWTRE